MNRAPRPKSNTVPSAATAHRRPRYLVLLAGAALTPFASLAQTPSPPLASSYATRDGRAPAFVLACVSTDGTFTAQPCGVAGFPVHVTIDGGVSVGGGGTPTTAPGTASPQLVGVQGGGAGSLPVSVVDSTVAQVVVQTQLAAAALGTPNDPAASSTGTVVAQLRRIATLLAAAPNSAVSADGGQYVHVTNQPATQPVSVAALPLPAGAATAAQQPAVNGDGGSQVHVQNFPATQAVTATSLPLPSGAAQDGTDAAGVTPPSGAAGIRGWLSGIYGALSGNLKVVVQAGGATVPVSATSLPLPSGAATAAAQPALNGDGGSQVHVQNFPATQGVTATSLPLPAGAATAAAQPALNTDGGGLAHVTNFPTTQPVTAAALPLPAGAATAALQPALNGDGGAQMHVQNFPATQAVTNTGSFPVQDSAAIAAASTIAANTANRSGAWADASFTATSTAGSPASLAVVGSRLGLHIWNVGSATACMNYTAAAASAGSGCAAGSVPIPAGSAYLEDQPGNVSPEAISLVCAGASCPLTIKVR